MVAAPEPPKVEIIPAPVAPIAEVIAAPAPLPEPVTEPTIESIVAPIEPPRVEIVPELGPEPAVIEPQAAVAAAPEIVAPAQAALIAPEMDLAIETPEISEALPIEPGPTFEETRGWVERLSRSIAGVVGELVSGAWEKQARGGRARLDYTQNAINKTLVAPYSVRASPAAPVSMPITWDELDDPDLRSDRWTIRDALDRLADVGDLTAPMLNDAQRLPTLE